MESGPIDYQRSDFLALSKDIFAVQPTWRKLSSWTLVILSPIIFVVGLLRQDSSSLVMAATVVMFVAGLFGLPRMMAASMAWGYKRNPMRGTQYFGVTGDGFATHSVNGDALLKWSAIRAVHRRDDVLIVYIGQKTAYLIPARAFASSAQFEEYASLARRCWDAARSGVAE